MPENQRENPKIVIRFIWRGANNSLNVKSSKLSMFHNAKDDYYSRHVSSTQLFIGLDVAIESQNYHLYDVSLVTYVHIEYR